MLAGAEGRLARLMREREILSDRLAAFADTPELAAVNELNAEITNLEQMLAQGQQDGDRARGQVDAARDAERAARDHLQQSETALARLESERSTLMKLLAAGKSDAAAPVVDSLKVDAGYETALGAALGDDLEAPFEQPSPIVWRRLPPFDVAPALPAGVEPLAKYVKGADALARRLSQVGVVADEETGARLMAELKPGQRLVTQSGALWRWDGFTAAADAPTAAAIRLSQRNRLEEVEREAAQIRAEVDQRRQAAADARAALDQAQEEEKRLSARLRETESQLSAARRKLSDAERRAAEQQAREAATRDSLRRIDNDIQETQAERDQTAAALEQLADSESLSAQVEDVRREVESLRLKLAEARARHDGIAGEVRRRKERLTAIAQDIQAWQYRLQRSEQQLQDLQARRTQTQAEAAALVDRPRQIAVERARLTEEIEKAEVARKEAADVLATAENELTAVDKALREVNNRLQEARERRVRVETTLEQLSERRREATTRIMDEFETSPADLPEAMEFPADLPELEQVEQRLDSLKKERERLGAVNLRADIELQEFEEQLGGLTKEREDLETAIQKLRQAISSLNREGRERLLAAFAEVNTHFGSLFRSLFGGGEAYLKLTESEDPLQAGLEIMASPPGKNLQVMSLLSGGEQALTALSLIFAVFMTNPAPICVLDEVDAPLDDANVERFCNLLDEMVRRTETRFLIVTHNAVTMSRMNRLFGVTMAERGVSQLVSVDLERAERLRAVG
jgi:chromosome segregation protein